MFRKVLAVTLALLLVFGLGLWGRAYAQGKFPDVSENHWAYKYITRMVEEGIIKGFPDGTFKPEATVTREQFATMIVLAKKLTLVSPATPTFKDVSRTRWSYKFVETAVKAGYVKGYPDGTFKPANPIKREELAALMIAVLGKTDEAKKFTKPVVFGNGVNEVDAWAAGVVTLAYRPDIQVLNFRPGRKIAPRDPATRAECAYSIYKGVISPPKRGGKVVVALEQEPDTLFSLSTSMLAASEILSMVEAGAVRRDPDGTLYPGEAVLNIPNFKDGTLKVYEENGEKKMKTTFYLRPGLKYNDGKPVNYKEDVPYAIFDLILSGKIPNLQTTDPYDKIAKLEWKDNYTLVVYWKTTTIYYYAGVAYYPKHAYGNIDPAQITATKYAKYPVADGPYMVKSWVEGSHITLVPNPYYIGWLGGKPLIDEFIFKFFPDSNTLMMNMISGAADVSLFGLGPKEIKSIQRAGGKNLNVRYIVSTAWEHWEFNVEDPILSDVKVRKALSFAINKKEIIDKVYFGTRPVADNFIIPGSFNEKPGIKIGGYDPEKAKKLLDEAGWKVGADGFRYKDGKKLTVEISTTTRQDRKESVTLEVEMLKKIGVDAVPKFFQASYYFGTYIPQGKHQICEFAWVGAPGEDWLGFFAPSMIPTEENNWNGANFSRYNNPRMEELYEISLTELDEVKRRDAYYEAQDLVQRDYPILPLSWYTDPYVWKKGLEGAFFGYVISSSICPTYNAHYWYWEG